MPASLTRHLSIALDLSSFALITTSNMLDVLLEDNRLGLRAQMTLQIIPGNRNIPIPLCARLCSAVWARLSFGVPIRGYTRGLRSVSVRIGRLRIHFLLSFLLGLETVYGLYSAVESAER